MQTSIITFDGKLDQLVGFKNSKGTYSLRKRITPHNPQTLPQRVQRARFKGATELGKALASNLFGLVPAARQKRITTRNLFTNLNLMRFEDFTADPNEVNVKLRWPELQLSTGGANQIIPGTPTATGAAVIFSWQVSPSASNDEVVHILCVNPKNMAVRSVSADITDNQATIPYTSDLADNQWECYCFTQSFLTANARASYYFSIEATGAVAESYLSSSAANSNFSETTFIGEVTLV